MKITIKEKLCEVLWRDLKIVMRPESLERNFDTRGEFRFHIRWDGRGSLENSGVRVGSFDTMADCVKWGVVFVARELSYIEICSNKPEHSKDARQSIFEEEVSSGW